MPRADNRFSGSGSLGVYLSGQQLTITQVVWSLGGLVARGMETLEVDPAGAGAALAGWLKSRFKPAQRRRLRLCVGLAPQQTYFTTRAVEETMQEAPPAAQLLEASSVGGLWGGDQALADSRLVRGSGFAGCCLAACRKGLAQELHQALSGLELRSYRLEPAPWSLLRSADRQAQPPRAWKGCLRVLVGPAQALAILAIEGQPVLWRQFACGGAGKHIAIASACRSLLAHARSSLGLREVGGLFLQGQVESDLAGRVEELLSLPAQAGSGEGPSEAAFSMGLALSARQNGPGAMDLLASLRPPPSISQIFPRRLAACLVLVTALMAALLTDRWQSLERDIDVLRRQDASNPWAASQTFAQIETQRKNLSAEVEAVHKFLSTRILWSDYLRDLPTRLPPNACLSNVWGACEMKESGGKDKRKTNKSLTLRCLSRFADRYSAPRDIDSFLDSLGGVELLQRDFPLVKLADIKWRREMDSEIAQFTIIALPREKEPPPKEKEEAPR